jgi:hypothetical protein
LLAGLTTGLTLLACYTPAGAGSLASGYECQDRTDTGDTC